MVKDEITGREVLRYGGDFDDRPSDYEFSGNGIVFADRTEKPAMQEVKYYYGCLLYTSYAKEATSEPIQIVVLGDSIAKGYCGANKPELYCYGQTVAEEIAQGAGKSYLYQNYAKNGLATREFNEKVLKGQEVQDSLSGADVILITMGSNDLLNEFKKTAQEILNTDTKFKSADEALKEVTAVSYTHLDVYKRQVQGKQHTVWKAESWRLV